MKNKFSTAEIKCAIQKGLQLEYGFFPQHKRDIIIWEAEITPAGDMLVCFRVRGHKYHIILREYGLQIKPLENSIKRIMA